MKKLISLFIICIAMLCPLITGCGNTNSVTKDGVQYQKSTFINNGVSSEGYTVVGCDSDVEILNIANEIKSLPVLKISQGAFNGNLKLKEVILPDTITSVAINGYAFSGCNNIEKMTLATCDVEYLFKNYGSGDVNNTNPLPESLKCIYLTNACTKIKARSFRYCRYLQELHIPSSVVEIDDGTGKFSVGVNGHTPSSDDFEDLPFLGCENLTVYCEAQSAPDTWDDYWNYIDSSAQAKTIWNNYDPNLNNSQNHPSNEDKDEYKLLATLDSSTISSYNSWSSIHVGSNGAVTIVLTEGFSDPGFRWDVSNYNFSIYSEYKIVFEDLSISGVDSPRNFTLRLNWQDSSYNYLKYYHTGSQIFYNNLDNDYRRIQLDSLSYETYSISFSFNHYAVTAATNKILYFDFDGVEPSGILSFDKLSILYRDKH